MAVGLVPAALTCDCMRDCSSIRCIAHPSAVLLIHPQYCSSIRSIAHPSAVWLIHPSAVLLIHPSAVLLIHPLYCSSIHPLYCSSIRPLYCSSICCIACACPLHLLHLLPPLPVCTAPLPIPFGHNTQKCSRKRHWICKSSWTHQSAASRNLMSHHHPLRLVTVHHQVGHQGGAAWDLLTCFPQAHLTPWETTNHVFPQRPAMH